MTNPSNNSRSFQSPSGWPANHPPEQHHSHESDDENSARKNDSDTNDSDEIKRRNLASDAAAGFEIQQDFERFNQRNDMFTRSFWDDSVRSKQTDAFFASYRIEAAPRRGDGFAQKDFALRNAAWSLSDIISSRSEQEGKREGFQAAINNDTPVAEEKVEIDDVQAQSAEIKRIAKLFGADLVGITYYDERWVYRARVDSRTMQEAPHDLPANLTNVIVLGHAMDYDLVQTYPSALAGAATGMEYSHEAAIVIQLASYIRNLGYHAVASMNDTSLVIPYAIKAGLGEYARNQMVITPEFGPRVRFSKIFTNLPLAHDQPKQIGIKEFCNICTECADACPPKALPYGPPSTDRPNQSTIKGVKKWSANCEKCFDYWTKLASDCAICMRVCPFNRKYDSIIARLFLRLASGRLRKLALWWHKRSKQGTRLRPKQWWEIQKN